MVSERHESEGTKHGTLYCSKLNHFSRVNEMNIYRQTKKRKTKIPKLQMKTSKKGNTMTMTMTVTCDRKEQNQTRT